MKTSGRPTYRYYFTKVVDLPFERGRLVGHLEGDALDADPEVGATLRDRGRESVR